MNTRIPPEALDRVNARLSDANTRFTAKRPGEYAGRQPVQTVYGGAHLFKSDTTVKLGTVSERVFAEYARDFCEFAHAFGTPGHESLPGGQSPYVAALSEKIEGDEDTARREQHAAWLANKVYTRVGQKLSNEAVEDFRIDFEDGFGNRPDDEEDATAVQAGLETATGLANGTLPPFIGIRIKPFSEELKARAIRTLDLYLGSLLDKSDGQLPDNFVITLPKITIPEHVEAMADLLDAFEEQAGLANGDIKIEIMIESPHAILGLDGRSPLASYIDAARGRCMGAHFGVYDYTASSNITAAFQNMRHPVCDFARRMMKIALADTGVMLSDGATNIMPIGPHRASTDGPALTADQERENREAVHHAWKLGYDDIMHSLVDGIYQGWDLNPAQFPMRYAAVYTFFFDGFEAAAARLSNFIDKAAQATLVGDIFDDAATGQALLNFFLRAISCGAITEEEAAVTGLSMDEIRTRSFNRILEGRRLK
jgi:citrate lyase beta subunit